MFVCVFAKKFPALASQSCYEVSRPRAVEEYEYRLFHYKHNQRVMPIFIAADDQWVITQNMSQMDVLGNHGYSNKYADMHPFFLAHGPLFKEKYVSEPFENVNIYIYPLMCHILGIEPAPNNDC